MENTIDFEKLLQKVTKTLFIGKLEYYDKVRYKDVIKYFAAGFENRQDVDLTEEEYNYLKQFETEGLW